MPTIIKCNNSAIGIVVAEDSRNTNFQHTIIQISFTMAIITF